jgi:hypothetical protein
LVFKAIATTGSGGSTAKVQIFLYNAFLFNRLAGEPTEVLPGLLPQTTKLIRYND